MAHKKRLNATVLAQQKEQIARQVERGEISPDHGQKRLGGLAGRKGK